MITFPIAKINLGLNVVEKRPDGYHNLETVFYPVPIKDALEIYPMDADFPSDVDCDLKVTNIHIEGDEQKNLVVKAYNLLKQDFPTLPRIHRNKTSLLCPEYTPIFIKVFRHKQVWEAVPAIADL